MEYVDIATKEQAISNNNVIIAENQERIYEAGKTKEWSDFWDTIQENGNRSDYNMAFCSRGYTKDNFRPKYDIKVISAESIFYQFNYQKPILDLVDHLEKLGVNLDFTNCSRYYSAFSFMNVSRIGTLDMAKAVSGSCNYNAFRNSQISTIEKFIFSENTDFVNMFNGADKLANINEIEGPIAKSINFSNCPLTLASAINVIKALKNYKGTDKESTCTLTFKASTWDLLDADAGEPETGLSWSNYIVEILGWSI